MYIFELVGEDDAFAAYEAATQACGVRRVAPGIALAEELSAHVDQLAFTRRVNAFIGCAGPSVAEATESLARTTFDSTGIAAVRARSIRGAGVDTQAAERALGSVLVERGFEIDLESPTHELRVVFTVGRAYLGWLVAEPGNDVARRPTDRPFFQPGSMAPRLARALVNLAGVHPGVRLLDPMCGTGGILLEAGRVGARPLGIDIQRHMVDGARRNCRAHLGRGAVDVGVGTATALPLDDRCVDTVVFDAPYGRQSHIGDVDGTALLAGALAEARRVADRAVVVADRPLGDRIREAGWRLRTRLPRRVHRSLTRHVHDLRPTA